MTWQEVSLGEVLPFRYGKGLPARDRSESGEYAVVSSAGCTGSHNVPLTTGPSIVIGRKGTIGSAYYCPNPVWPIDTTFYVEPSSSTDIRFAYYLLSSLPLNEMNNDSAVPGLNRAQAEGLKISLPTLPEQRAIAATLGALDDKIESNRRAISLMEELARSTFEHTFDLAPVDDGVALSELVDVNPRRILYSGAPATYVGMSSLQEFSAEVYKWETREVGSGQRFVLGDVLMARITPCLENGKTAVVDMLQPDEVGWGSTEYVVLSPAGLFSTAWVYCLVRDERIRDFAIRSMTGTSGRQRFQANRFSEYRIVVPEAADLIGFNAVAAPLFTKMTQLRDESLKLAALRDALLPELLFGRMRVPIEGVAT